MTEVAAVHRWVFFGGRLGNRIGPRIRQWVLLDISIDYDSVAHTWMLSLTLCDYTVSVGRVPR